MVAGTFDDTDVDRVEVRVVRREEASGTATDWVPAEIAAGEGTFAVALIVQQGWYDLHARSLRGATVVSENAVHRVGVGEVFVTAGQSNSANSGQPRLRPMDDRVSAWGEGRWRHAVDPQPIATADGGSPWPHLGDLLAAELDVPVGFISVGWGGTSVRQWLPGGNLYGRLQEALAALRNHGLRAVLWHQGETDHVTGTSTAEYAERLQAVISQTRADADFDVPWGVALASFVPQVEPPVSEAVIQGQRQVIATDPNVFEGPATDPLAGFSWRHDGIHFNEVGLREHARLWAESIEAHFDLSTRPEARIRLASRTVEELATLRISGETSGAYAGRSVDSWQWDFGDGTVGEGASVSHAYKKHGHYTIRLLVTDDAGETDFSVAQAVVVVRPEDVEPWRIRAVGTTGFGSGERADGDCLLVGGGGEGLFGFEDGFRFLYQRVSGDVRLTARVVGLSSASKGASAGVVVRESLQADARFGSTLRRLEGDVTRVSSTRRRVTIANRRSSIETAGEWLRVERRGAELISSFSEDGATWVEIERYSLELGETYFAGLAVASLGEDTDLPAFARFCEVVLEALGPPFLRGDCDGGGSVNGLADAVFLLSYTFLGTERPGCLAACDTDADGRTGGTADAVYLLNFFFRGGPAPLAPYPQCGREAGTDRSPGCVETNANCL